MSEYTECDKLLHQLRQMKRTNKRNRSRSNRRKTMADALDLKIWLDKAIELLSLYHLGYAPKKNTQDFLEKCQANFGNVSGYPLAAEITAPDDGWFPSDELAIVAQTLFKSGKMIGQVVKNSLGWRPYSLLELNASKTGGKPLTDGSLPERVDAKAIVEEYSSKQIER